MDTSVLGCGYLGVAHAAGLARLGHSVVGVDIDEIKVQQLNQGIAPMYEPQLNEELLDGLRGGRLRFTTDFTEIGRLRESPAAHFICVGTPQRPDGPGSDLGQVDAAVDSLLPFLSSGDVVVGKSTVPVGTAEPLNERIKQRCPGAVLVWNPEFLREGHAVIDTLEPDRLVYGVPEGARGHEAALLLDRVYAELLTAGTPRLIVDYATAELVKTCANAFLTTKISFINAMAEICDTAGADVTFLADALGHDPRIGRQFLNAGLGFGGGCLPKDLRAFITTSKQLNAERAVRLLREVESTNTHQRERVFNVARELCAGSFIGKRIAVLGAAFTPNSDDTRESPALVVAARIHVEGGDVVVTDPAAVANARAVHPQLSYAGSVPQACAGADLVLLLTEWEEYRSLDPAVIREVVRAPRVLDGRAALDPQRWRDAGWTYKALGRP